MMKGKFNTVKNIFSRVIIPLVVITIVLVQGRNIAKEVNFVEVINILRNIPIEKIIILGLVTVIAITSIALYDVILVRYFGYDIKLGKIVQISVISSTFNNLMGLGGIVGATFRGIFFKDQKFKNNDIIHYNILLVPSTMIGLSILMFLGLFKIINLDILLSQYSWLIFALIGFILFLPLYLFFDKVPFIKKAFLKGNMTMEISYKIKLKLILASTIEWLLACILFFMITQLFSSNVNIRDVVGIFALAVVAGIISLTPGGIGAFDLLALVGLKSIGFSANDALSVMILFRILYYIIPWFVGALLSVSYITKRYKNRIKEKFGSTIGGIKESNTILRLSRLVITTLVIFTGIIMILNSFNPVYTNIGPAQESVINLLSKVPIFLQLGLGILLIVVSRDVFHGVRYSLNWTLGIILVYSIISFFVYSKVYLLIFMIVVMIAVYISKYSFNRITYSYNIVRAIFTQIIIVLSILFFGLVTDVIKISLNGIIREGFITLNYEENYKVEVLVTCIIMLLVFNIYYLMRPKYKFEKSVSKENIEAVERFLEKNTGNYFTHLIFTGDKNIFWNSKRTVIFSYSNTSNKIIVLGDPIGKKSDFKSAIYEIQDYFYKYGLRVIFYEVDEELLSLYHENGYNFFKLGEEGIINLNDFKMSSNMKKNYNKTMRMLEDDGYILEFIEPPFNNEILNELKSISDEWLGDRKEKGFSLGYFNEEYVNRASIFVLKNKTGNIEAFMTLRPYYDNGKNISIDLMRHKNSAPKGTMDAMFIGMINWAREGQYENFIIGMAPLSKVGEFNNSYSEERLARLIYKYGGNLYGFTGLRSYKEKYKPEWKSKYLCYKKKTRLPIIWIEIALLVSKNKK